MPYGLYNCITCSGCFESTSELLSQKNKRSFFVQTMNFNFKSSKKGFGAGRLARLFTELCSRLELQAENKEQLESSGESQKLKIWLPTCRSIILKRWKVCWKLDFFFVSNGCSSESDFPHIKPCVGSEIWTILYYRTCSFRKEFFLF